MMRSQKIPGPEPPRADRLGTDETGTVQKEYLIVYEFILVLLPFYKCGACLRVKFFKSSDRAAQIPDRTAWDRTGAITSVGTVFLNLSFQSYSAVGNAKK